MRRFLAVVLLVMAACPGPKPCTSITCEGCCTFATPSDPGTCHAGDDTAFCGVRGSVCARCETGETCSPEFKVCRGADEAFPSGAKFVFATSQTFTGDFGGLDGGDAKCQALAADAGLSGSYLAFLSDVTEAGQRINAVERFTGNGPWVMRTRDARGKVLRPFDDRASLAGPPRSPIDQDETGHVFALFDKRQVWTGTLLDGGAELPMPMRDTTCRRWSTQNATGLYGIVDVPTEKWSGLGAVACASDNRLYCFEQ